MTLSERNIKSTEVYPADYQIFHENDNLQLIYGKNTKFFQITNRQQILQRLTTDETNWLLAAGKEKNASDVSDWLEPETGGYMMFYNLAFGILSDRNVQVQISNPGSGNYLLGTKTQGIARITPSLSPISAPTVTLTAIDTMFKPSFIIKNPSEYTLKSCILGVKGYKYRLSEPLDHEPHYYTTFNMNNLLEG
ncbi:MAG: hypothetical protein JRE23_08145 [Deltaproteobacteria bacterium]|nr:hypothetical protein [Deltaproteobacteria bacterium]